MKIWLICDDYYHPGEVVSSGFLALEKEGFEFTVTMNAAEIDVSKLKEYQAVAFSKSNNVCAGDRSKWFTPDLQRNFADYVENGGGLLVTHSGTASYKDEKIFTELVGCVFTHHPEQCPVTMTMLKKHPIAAGVGLFTEKDEHYFIDILAEDADIFMAASSSNGVQAGGYTRSVGRGRVCVLTQGHNAGVWHNTENQRLLKNALLWCGK